MVRFTLAMAVLAIAAYAALAAPAFLEGKIRDENGFEGAVTIVEYGVDKKDADFGFVTAEIPYRDIEGKPKKGQGRLYVRRAALESGKPVPPFCHVHYEKDMNGARPWCERGWAVVSSHYGDAQNGGYALELCTGDSNNLSRALIEWVRRLPFIDRTHLHIDGGSAGGYMALAMSADMFPVAATTADAPVCNWAYNVNYFVANKPASGYPLPDFNGAADIKRSPLPIMYLVTGLADQSMGVFGDDLAADAYYLISPISYLDRITCPTLVLCATGDMLVPMEQMTRDIEHAIDTSLFPESYARDFDTLTLSPKARRCFDEFLPDYQVAVTKLPLADDMHEITLAHFLKEEEEPLAPPSVDRPWDESKQWNIVVLDEGAPKPFSPHTRYNWRTHPDAFVDAHLKATPTLALLNPAKLDRLLQRYAGELEGLAILAKTGQPMNRLNYQPLEKLDVVAGLLDYADLSPAHAETLLQLYAVGDRKPFGDSIRIDVLREELQVLRKDLGIE
jgi:acetyl esterase/lipase